MGPYLIVSIALASFALFWCVLLTLLARVSGWAALARRYKENVEPHGQAFRWMSLRFGWCDYNGCLTVRVCEDGLGINVWPPFNVGHAPLLIPWSDLTVTGVRDGRWSRDVTVSVGTPPVTTIRLPLRVFEEAKRLGYAGG